jgi:predicted phosphohydrolase
MRLVCLSDTHGLHDSLDVPDGDVLVHAGDCTRHGNEDEVRAFAAWLARLPHRDKVVIAGNHDWLFERKPEKARELLGDVHYLLDEEVTLGGLRFFGAPWQPWFFDWAFNLRRGPELAAAWARIPDGIDVLVTHGPPMGVLDEVAPGRGVGCEELGKALERVRPRLHVFGHIHEGYGVARNGETLSVNACNCDVRYRPVNPAVVVEWGEGRPVQA